MAGKKRPVCETPGCGRKIPFGGEGSPEICKVCLAALELYEPKLVALVKRYETALETIRDDWKPAKSRSGVRMCDPFTMAHVALTVRR